MTTFNDPRHASGEATPGDQPPLPFEAEFDGSRRAKAARDPQPCDPNRYWDFFSETD